MPEVPLLEFTAFDKRLKDALARDGLTDLRYLRLDRRDILSRDTSQLTLDENIGACLRLHGGVYLLRDPKVEIKKSSVGFDFFSRQCLRGYCCN